MLMLMTPSQACSMPQVTRQLSTNTPFVNSKIEELLNPHCKTTGTLGSPKMISDKLPVSDQSDAWVSPLVLPDLISPAAGLNHVRIPIGFWAYDVSGGEPYIQGAADHLDQAIGWARNHNLKVLIDLHGAPGSQNGYDNSGKRGNAEWNTDSNNVLRTKLVIQSLAQKYSDPSYWQVVTMLGLLNEPATYLNSDLLATTRQYWYDAYGAARYPWAASGSASKSGLALVIHDGFQPISTFNNYMTEPNFEDVFLDTHNYQVFSNEENARDWPTHISVSRVTAPRVILTFPSTSAVMHPIMPRPSSG
jgi:hypothetical protein